MMTKRLLLTGATGFLGSSLARYWAHAGHELCLLARPGSVTHRIDDLLTQVKLVRVSDIQSVMEAVHTFEPNVIIHTASSYGRNGESPLVMLDSNLRLGTALLQAALTLPTVDGALPLTVLNTGTVLAPNVSLYALSKTQFSAWGAALAEQMPERLRFIDIRLQHMYGPGDDRSKFTSHVIDACRRNEPYLALTAGEQRRDFIHIDDVVRAYDCILERQFGFASSDAIDVGSGDAVTIRSFVEMVKNLCGAETELDFGAIPYRVNEAMLCVADTERLRGLGWRPQISLTEGLTAMLNLPQP
jgi:nucleoside-diphosphate-sugar epimerase